MVMSYETDEDPIDAVDIIHEVLQGQVDHMKATKRQLQQGDKNAISDALVSNQVEARELAKFAASAPSFEEEDEDEDEFITNFDFSSMSEDHMDVTELEPFLEHFSAEELASMYMDDEIIDILITKESQNIALEEKNKITKLIKEGQSAEKIFEQTDKRFLEADKAAEHIARLQEVKKQNSGSGRMLNIFGGIGLIVLTGVLLLALDRLFYVLPVMGLVMIVKGFTTESMS